MLVGEAVTVGDGIHVEVGIAVGVAGGLEIPHASKNNTANIKNAEEGRFFIPLIVS